MLFWGFWAKFELYGVKDTLADTPTLYIYSFISVNIYKKPIKTLMIPQVSSLLITKVGLSILTTYTFNIFSTLIPNLFFSSQTTLIFIVDN